MAAVCSDPQRAGRGVLMFPGKKPGWHAVSRCYSSDRDCLASFLAVEVAEVVMRAKPANLISLSNKRHACGRNLYTLWKEHGASLLRGSDLDVKVLADRGSSILLLLFNPEALASLLAQKNVQAILTKAGYREAAAPGGVLAELERRVAGQGFPHEIGVFLGYPLKDVVGFMGWAPLSFTCQGPWKIFGNPTESLRLAEKHRECRCRAALSLASGCTPEEWLQGKHREKFLVSSH